MGDGKQFILIKKDSPTDQVMSQQIYLSINKQEISIVEGAQKQTDFCQNRFYEPRRLRSFSKLPEQLFWTNRSYVFLYSYIILHKFINLYAYLIIVIDFKIYKESDFRHYYAIRFFNNCNHERNDFKSFPPYVMGHCDNIQYKTQKKKKMFIETSDM